MSAEVREALGTHWPSIERRLRRMTDKLFDGAYGEHYDNHHDVLSSIAIDILRRPNRFLLRHGRNPDLDAFCKTFAAYVRRIAANERRKHRFRRSIVRAACAAAQRDSLRAVNEFRLFTYLDTDSIAG